MSLKISTNLLLHLSAVDEPAIRSGGRRLRGRRRRPSRMAPRSRPACHSPVLNSSPSSVPGARRRVVVDPGRTLPVAAERDAFGGARGPRFRAHEAGRSAEAVFAVRSLERHCADMYTPAVLGTYEARYLRWAASCAIATRRRRTLETGAVAVDAFCRGRHAVECVGGARRGSGHVRSGPSAGGYIAARRAGRVPRDGPAPNTRSCLWPTGAPAGPRQKQDRGSYVPPGGRRLARRHGRGARRSRRTTPRRRGRPCHGSVDAPRQVSLYSHNIAADDRIVSGVRSRPTPGISTESPAGPHSRGSPERATDDVRDRAPTSSLVGGTSSVRRRRGGVAAVRLAASPDRAPPRRDSMHGRNACLGTAPSFRIEARRRAAPSHAAPGASPSRPTYLTPVPFPEGPIHSFRIRK